MATSSSIHHRRTRLVGQAEQPPAPVPLSEGKGEGEEEARDWAELPVDALLAVLRRLDFVDILTGAGHVCRPWRRATREEPELWRRVDMRRRADLAYDVDLEAAARAAVRRSAGRCEAFWAEIFVDNDFFLFLADAAPMLKSLRLISCSRILSPRMNEVIRRFPLLEELELSHYRWGSIATCLAGVGAACPLLTRLRLNHDRFYYWRPDDTGGCEAAEIAAMPGLRSLQLFANSLSNADLAAILDGCRRLESLDIRHCFNVSMNGEMRARCAGVKALQMPKDSMEGYDLPYASPVRDCVYYSGVMYPDF